MLKKLPLNKIMMNRLFKGKSKYDTIDDLGLGSATKKDAKRVVNKNGTFNLIRKGEKFHIYHMLISMSWPKFLLLILFVFTIVNGIFAFIYLFIGIEYVSGIEPKGFLLNLVNLFHFSVQTMTTVGYGAMHPLGIATGVVASFEALLGLLSFALISGLIYGRFSNPKAEIKYSNNMLIAPLNNIMSLQVRIANQLSHDLFEVSARILMLHSEKKQNGTLYTKYTNLPLQLDKISFMPMNWTITHAIDNESPLYGMTKEDMEAKNIEFLVVVNAFDDSFSQNVFSRSSYLCSELVFNAKWKPAYSINKNGRRVFDIEQLDKFDVLKNETS